MLLKIKNQWEWDYMIKFSEITMSINLHNNYFKLFKKINKIEKRHIRLVEPEFIETHMNTFSVMLSI